jgi:hypothetical protein
VSLLLVEVALRAIGNRPYTFRRNPAFPTLNDPDPELGWWLRPGHWRLDPRGPGGRIVEITIGSDRTRRTRPETDTPAGGASLILVLGCSFTFGWGVSDDETWPWRLQALRPDLDVRNRGTGAYGTFQSLLLLERVLASGERPSHVLYGYIPQHGVRNVAEPHWVRLLTIFNDPRTVGVPYCSLGASGQLVRHPPEFYPTWPLHDRSAAVALLEWHWARRSAARRQAEEYEVTRQLVREMAALCRAHGIRFSIVVLHVDPPRRDVLLPFARAQGIDVIDCNRPLGRDEFIHGGTHPNGRAHDAWGRCVANALADGGLAPGSTAHPLEGRAERVSRAAR